MVVNAVTSGGWSWACYAFLVGYFRRSKIESALLSSFGLAIGVVVYYLYKNAGAVPSGELVAGTPNGGLPPGILLWGTLAFVFGAPIGFLGNVARVPGIGGLFFRLLIPLVAFYETSMRLATEARGPDFTVVATWSSIRVIAVAVAVALVVHTIWWHFRRTRYPRPEELDDRASRAAS